MKDDVDKHKLTGYQIMGMLLIMVLVLAIQAYLLKHDSEKLRAMDEAEIKVSDNRCLIQTASGRVLLTKPCDKILDALSSKS